MSIGISLSVMKLLICPKAASSMNKPKRLPSSPRTESLDALPTPPVLRMVTPATRANTSFIEEAVPCSSLAVITETGMPPSRNFRASLRSVITTSCNWTVPLVSCFCLFRVSLAAVGATACGVCATIVSDTRSENISKTGLRCNILEYSIGDNIVAKIGKEQMACNT